YEAAKDFVADIITWRLSGGPTKDPEFFAVAARKLLEADRQFSTATATALGVLRRSRPRRFRRGTQDHALRAYDDLIQRTLTANGRMMEYVRVDIAQFSLRAFEDSVGAQAFEFSNLLRRVTGELLAR